MPLMDKDGTLYWVRDWAQEAKDLKLPESAGQAEVREELNRLYFASELGLSKDATWNDIINKEVMIARVEMAQERGLSDDATWLDIQEHDDNQS